MFNLDRWIENFEGYLDARIELVKYDLKELIVDLLTKSVFVLGVAVFGLAGLICLNFGLAYLISYFIGIEFSGFLILSVVYFSIALIFLFNRKNTSLNEKIERKIRESMNQPKAVITENETKND